jgi:predicted nucleic acid-binding Zn ribbon protein
MPRHRKKICLYCYKPFEARSDAKTCSARCRKGLQRTKSLYQAAITAAEQENVLARRRYAMSLKPGSYYAER